MGNWPHVTAIVNTYERPVKLRRALASVLAQDFADFETIVVHDGPASKATEDVLEEFGAKFAAAGRVIHCIATEENSGYQCQPKNIATWLAQGDYIAYLDDDNEWTPNHLSALVAAIEEGHKWPDFTYGRREYRKEDTCTRNVKTGPSAFVPFEDNAVARMAESPKFNFIDTSDALIAKGAIWRMFLATGKMWNEEMRRFGDWEFFTRGIFFSGWRGKGVDKVVQNYYWHGENLQLTRPATEMPGKVAP